MRHEVLNAVRRVLDRAGFDLVRIDVAGDNAASSSVLTMLDRRLQADFVTCRK